MSHVWRELDHALQEATIIHREFMVEKAHMNNTSFSRIRNMDNITDMGYSLNRVSPILRDQQTPAQSANPRNPTSTPRQKRGLINKNSIPQGTDTQHEGRASPYDPDRSVENHLRGEAAGPDMKHKVHKHLLLIMCKFLFRTLQDMYPVQLVPWANVTTDIHSRPTRDRVRRLPIILIHSLLFQPYFHKLAHTHRAGI